MNIMTTEKIDRRRGYYIMLDDETCPIDRTVEGVDPNNMLAYDIGFAVCDKHGNIYEQGSLVIAEIFYGEREKMQNSYYFAKLPKYREAIELGYRKIVTLNQAREIIRTTMEKWGTNVIVGHNIRFDVVSLNRTCDWLTGGLDSWFFPYDTVFYDTMYMAQDTICKQKAYIKFCEENNYIRKDGKPRATVEILTRYITDDDYFEEEHQGIYDVYNQIDIMAKCFAQHKPMRKRWGN